jgi:hypothetical protein
LYTGTVEEDDKKAGSASNGNKSFGQERVRSWWILLVGMVAPFLVHWACMLVSDSCLTNRRRQVIVLMQIFLFIHYFSLSIERQDEKK